MADQKDQYKLKSDSPAVLGGAEVASVALSRYRVLGVEDWAKEQAEKDAERSIRGLEVFFEVHRLNAQFSDRVALRNYYSDLWLSGRFIPMAKWASAYFLADMAKVHSTDGTVFHDLPPRPDFVPPHIHPLKILFPLGSSQVVQVLRARLQERRKDGNATKRALNLAWSLLGLKAMFPPMWVDQVSQSLQDHSQLLSSDPPPLTGSMRHSLEVVAETVARMATPGVTLYSSLPRPRLSASAGWVKLYDQDSRRWTTMRGTRAAQYQALTGLAGSLFEELYSMDYSPSYGVGEFRQTPYQFNWQDWDFDPTVSVVALQEPFKIRTISIADGPVTAAASPLQKAWHSAMRGLQPFSLIGGKRVADKVRDVFPNFDLPFVSGDYSAATDRLSMRATRVVLNRLLSHVPLDPELRRRIEVSLTGSVLDYSRTLESFRGKVPDSILDSISLPPLTQQTNGQLMGNVLSFPILCMVNLAGYLTALSGSDSPVGEQIRVGLDRGYFTPKEMNSLPVLINGDDILFQCSPEDYTRWLRLLPSLGLKPSVGKNYYSSEFFTINSELYTREGFQSRPWWGGFETDLVRLRNEIKFEVGEDVLQADMRRVLPKLQSFLRETVPEIVWPKVNKIWLKNYREAGLLEAYSR